MNATAYRKKLFSLLAIGAWVISVATLVAACQPQPNQVFIEVDGRRQSLTTESETVRQAVDEAQIRLGPLDRVSPDLYVSLEPGLEIKVIRVEESFETRREPLPFERQTVVNEALAPGDTRMAQLGVTGEEEITIKITLENGVEIARQEVDRQVIEAPIPEILVIGSETEALPPTPIEGTIAYVSNGNAWLMRGSNENQRALTTSGDLDGRVFSLSANGRQLLYTRGLTDEIELPLNQLWIMTTTIVGESPTRLPIEGVLNGAWSPNPDQADVIFSTAERTPNPPGWQANNDLWRLSFVDGQTADPEEILPANTRGLYPWWGTDFKWSPDGTRLAYARADQVGIIELPLTGTISITEDIKPLVDFVPLQTFSDWVWVPGLSWSPDGQFLSTVVHGPPLAAESPEESPVFDLWIYSVDSDLKLQIADQVGMWSSPQWGAETIVFGQAVDALQSVTSRYTINIVDRDGSNRQKVFPLGAENGVQLPQFAWSPDGEQLLYVDDGDLYLIRQAGAPPRQLTSDSTVTQVQWVATAASVSPTLTPTVTISQTESVTSETIIDLQPTTTITPTTLPKVTPLATDETEGE